MCAYDERTEYEMRKTFDIETVKNHVNAICSDTSSDAEAKGIRMGAAAVLEEILFATGNYKGFEYVQKIGNEHMDFDSTVRRYF
jgi:hypothetical protein